jgi:adenine-specific DNA-methyltransferase
VQNPKTGSVESRRPEIVMPVLAKVAPPTKRTGPALAFVRDEDVSPETMPKRALAYPELRYMGSKNRLLPWIHGVLSTLPFETAADPFLGSGCVAYLMKAMGKRVRGSDFLNFPVVLATATLVNSKHRLDARAIAKLIARAPSAPDFIERTYSGIFYTPADLRFLDGVSANLALLGNEAQAALARAALIRSCLKKQPRGVFTISGDLSRYDDGRRDLRMSLQEHFIEQCQAFNGVVFDNGRRHTAERQDVFGTDPTGVDLVYLDPPYVPRADDNCYMKRYHFLEGLSCYWDGLDIMEKTKTKKVAKPFSAFGSRKHAVDAFDRMFEMYERSIIVLSYSSNGYPDLGELVSMMKRYKGQVTVHEKAHRYHFGTHAKVARSEVQEYLIVGR